jgi:hypothetical protein
LFRAPPTTICAQRLIAADGEALFLFLADLEAQLFLAGRSIEVVGLDGPAGARSSGELRIRGPLGLRRTAYARVLASVPPHQVVVRADIERGTVVLISWTLAAGRGTIEVELAAVLHSAGLLDRLALLVGGRRLARRRLETTLAALAELAAIVAEFITVDGSDHPSGLPQWRGSA